LLANAKLSDEKRWYAENLDLEDPQPRESDDIEYSGISSTDTPIDYNAEPLDDDVDSGHAPQTGLSPTALLSRLSEYDFDDQDVAGENEEDLLPLARFANRDDMLKNDSILHHGETSISRDFGVKKGDENVLSKENTISGSTKDGAKSQLRGKEKIASSSQEQPLLSQLSGGASQSLFGTATTKVPVSGLKSSLALVSLSKEMKGGGREVETDRHSSDWDVPLAKLFQHQLGVEAGNTSKTKPPTECSKKRKASTPMLPFARGPAKTPLDAVEMAKKFITIPRKVSKRKIKEESSTDGEDDLSGSSGAEVKNDSDYELPTDINE